MDFLLGPVPERRVIPGGEPVRGGPVVERDQVDAGSRRPRSRSMAPNRRESAPRANRAGDARWLRAAARNRQRHVLRSRGAESRAGLCCQCPARLSSSAARRWPTCAGGLADLDRPASDDGRRARTAPRRAGRRAGRSRVHQLLGILGVIRRIGLDPDPAPEPADTRIPAGGGPRSRRRARRGARAWSRARRRGLRQDGGPACGRAGACPGCDSGVGQSGKRVPSAGPGSPADRLQRVYSRPASEGAS